MPDDLAFSLLYSSRPGLPIPLPATLLLAPLPSPVAFRFQPGEAAEFGQGGDFGGDGEPAAELVEILGRADSLLYIGRHIALGAFA